MEIEDVNKKIEEKKTLERIVEISKDEALEFSESIINTIRRPLIVLDRDLRVVYASHSFYEFFKVNPEETVGQLIYDLGNKQWDIPSLRELLETILPQKTTFDNYEVEHDFATIGRRTMLLNARQIQRVSGKERIILLAIDDITARREIENSLEKIRKELSIAKISEDKALEFSESLINAIREPLITLDQDLRVVSASHSFYKFFKVKPKETVGQLIYDLGNKQWDIPSLRELLENILPQKATFDNFEVKHNFTTIGSRTMLLNARQIQRVSEKGGIILLAIEDITARRDTEAEIVRGYRDQLTGTYNRRFFEEEIKRLDTKRQLPISVIMGDLNGLKLINDTFGHFEGDKILREAAELLKRTCRSEDILARWGGDEFVILLPKTSIKNSEMVLQRIKKECSKFIMQKMTLSLSVGLATKIEEKQSIDEIIIEAESNMYKHKLIEKESNGSSIIFALEQALFEKSNETMEHAFRMKEFAIKLGKSINLASYQLDELSLLASLHDIGKVALSETILLKEDELTKRDWEDIKRHPGIGFNIAHSSPQINHVAKFILACHENWDGSGYPQGLAGEAIPILSRIMLIADAYDVMTNDRVYKKAIGSNAALEELIRCAGTQFDPVLVDKFIGVVSN